VQINVPEQHIKLALRHWPAEQVPTSAHWAQPPGHPAPCAHDAPAQLLLLSIVWLQVPSLLQVSPIQSLPLEQLIQVAPPVPQLEALGAGTQRPAAVTHPVQQAPATQRPPAHAVPTATGDHALVLCKGSHCWQWFAGFRVLAL
jgi:hypothetical protein